MLEVAGCEQPQQTSSLFVSDTVDQHNDISFGPLGSPDSAPYESRSIIYFTTNQHLLNWGHKLQSAVSVAMGQCITTSRSVPHPGSIFSRRQSKLSTCLALPWDPCVCAILPTSATLPQTPLYMLFWHPTATKVSLLQDHLMQTAPHQLLHKFFFNEH